MSLFFFQAMPPSVREFAKECDTTMYEFFFTARYLDNEGSAPSSGTCYHLGYYLNANSLSENPIFGKASRAKILTKSSILSDTGTPDPLLSSCIHMHASGPERL